jgi:hypothetical protein
MERVFTPVFTGEDLQNIGFGQIFLTLLIDGMASKPFSAATLLPIHPKEEPHSEEVIEMSRKMYSRPRAEIEQKVLDWFATQQKKIAVASLGKKVAVTPVASKESEVVAGKEKEVSMKLSSTMSGLLDQLDNLTSDPIIETANKNPEIAPEMVSKPAPAIKPLETKPVAAVQAAPKKLEKEIKDRAATPATKNVLLEALQKAQVQREAEKPAPVEKDPDALKNALQKAHEASAEPEKPKVVTKVVKQVVATVEETREEEPVKKKVREVPEDILKKILE